MYMVLSVVDPFDQIEPEKDSIDNIMDKVYKIVSSSFKVIMLFILFLFITVYLSYLVYWVYFVDEGTIVQPFEISGMKNVSGMTVADLLSFELNHILEIDCAQKENTVITSPIQNIDIPITQKMEGGTI